VVDKQLFILGKFCWGGEGLKCHWDPWFFLRVVGPIGLFKNPSKIDSNFSGPHSKTHPSQVSSNQREISTKLVAKA
jgi:hypothetical protein